MISVLSLLNIQENEVTWFCCEADDLYLYCILFPRDNAKLSKIHPSLQT